MRATRATRSGRSGGLAHLNATRAKVGGGPRESYAIGAGSALSGRTWPSWLRELMSSFENTLRRW
jgi:hypothetical protein